MPTYVDLNTLHNPATSTAPPATYGDQIRENFEYLHQRGPYICTSATRPASPFEGQHIYETDTDKVLIYTGSQWRKPWDEPWGRIGSAIISADQTGITALADLTGFTLTFTAVANRMYLVQFLLGATQVTSPGSQQYNIYESAVDQGIAFRQNPIAAGDLTMVTGFMFVSGLAAGSRTLKMRGSTSAGTLTIHSGSLVNGRFGVTDVGPNGTPA